MRNVSDIIFTSREIDEEIFNKIKGLSYKDNCDIDLRSLRYLTITHYNFEHLPATGEIICSVAIADDLLDIFETLFHQKYEIEKVRLIDYYDADDEKSMADNNSSAFNFRTIAGTNVLSNHSTGMAIDINPLYNPYVKRTENGLLVSPEVGKPFVDRLLSFPHKLDHDDICVKEFLKHGFVWGGDWEHAKDYQHFEKVKTH